MGSENVSFTPMKPEEQQRMREMLRRNVEEDKPIGIGKDTSALMDLSDNEVAFAIKSVPCHY